MLAASDFSHTAILMVLIKALPDCLLYPHTLPDDCVTLVYPEDVYMSQHMSLEARSDKLGLWQPQGLNRSVSWRNYSPSVTRWL